MVDHMLIKLGKYLRILGYDAEWDRTVRTHALILRANSQRRIFVTRNQHLADEYPQPQRRLQVQETDPVAQLRQVVLQHDLDAESYQFSKCIRCNVLLDAVPDKTAIESSVEPGVFREHDTFFRCPRCGTVFWHGSHVRNTRRKLGLDSGRDT